MEDYAITSKINLKRSIWDSKNGANFGRGPGIQIREMNEPMLEAGYFIF